MGNATQQDVARAGANFVAATTALASSPFAKGFSNLAGLTASAASLSNDLDNFHIASTASDTRARDAAFVAIVGDAAGLGQVVATGVGAMASLAGEGALVAAAASMGTAAGAIGAVATAVGWGMSTIYGIADYFQELDNQLMRSKDWNDFILDFGSINQNGQSILVMAGQAGDALTTNSLAGNAFEYSEIGSRSSSVLLAFNGGIGSETFYGQDVVSDVSSFHINLTTNSRGEFHGDDNDFNLGNGSSAGIYGSRNSISMASYSGSRVALIGKDNYVAANGGGISFGLNASSANVVGSDNVVDMIANSGAYTGLFGANFHVNSVGNVVALGGVGTSAAINGANTVWMTSNNQTLDYTSPGSTINASPNVTGTAIYTNNSTINGGTGFGGSISGSDNTLTLGASSGASVGLFGANFKVNSAGNVIALGGEGTSASINGSNTVWMTSNNQTITFASPGSTINTSPTVTGTTINTNNSTINGGTGFWGDVNGSNNFVTLGAYSGANANLTGKGNGVQSNGNTVNLKGTGSSADVSGVDGRITMISYSGEYAGVFGQNMTVNSVGNTVALGGAGTSATVNGANTVWMTSNNQTVTLTTAGSIVSAVANVKGSVIKGSNTTVSMTDNAGANISGSGNTITAGAHSSVSANGNSNTIKAGVGSSLACTGGGDMYVSGAVITLGGATGNFCVYGDNNTIYSSDANYNMTIQVFGNGNSVGSTKAHVYMNGSDKGAGGHGGEGAGTGRGGDDREGHVDVGPMTMMSGRDIGPADSTTQQVDSLVAAMAVYGADSSATSAFVAPAQNDTQMLLAASA
ncbi:DUF3060 domain-containing protein [Caballeronia sp. NK8]|uniref:beta strand repeat-containing protein n=1 Tax=Caballeronia sp. NK8 TaxID=140098 RepID=UPI001BCF1CC3|nr:DUF3060 domain-containing protein [Caballeronia sp. NK8]